MGAVDLTYTDKGYQNSDDSTSLLASTTHHHKPGFQHQSDACGCCRNNRIFRPFYLFFTWLGDTGRVLFAVVLSIIIGFILKALDPDGNYDYRLVELPGDIWIRGLKLFVLPLIVSNMVVALNQLSSMPNGGSLARSTVTYYLFTSASAIVISLVFANLFMLPFIGTIEYTDDSSSIGIPEEPKDVTDQIVDIFFGLVPDNIVKEAADDGLMGVIIFSIILGLHIQRPQNESTILNFFQELSEVTMRIIQRLVWLTPIGVFCLILPKVATIDLVVIGQYLGLLLGIMTCALLGHALVTLPTVFWFITRRNPWKYYRNLVPAWLTAIGTSSSAATLPVTTTCCVEKNDIDPRIADFVLPLGATVNMDGTAVKYPMMVLWLAAAQV